MTQTDKILRYLQENGSITPLDALREFGCMRLGARVWDLKDQGVRIVKTMDSAKNKYGETVHFARYRLEK